MAEEAPIPRLLEHWRKARHTSTSELIHLLSARLEVELPKLPPKKSDAARAWLIAVKGEPPALLAARLRQLEAFIRNTTPTLVWPLFEALSKRPADPRIATLATRLLVGDVGHTLTVKLTRRLLDCVETHGDDAHFRALELGLPVTLLDDGLAARALRVMQRGLAQRPEGPELPAAERKALAATRFDAPQAVSAQSLFAPVWAAPRDPAPRQVLADALLEQGDPRGEFISLQLADASHQRQRALLKQFGRQWLGALADVVDLKADPPRFEGGFAAEVSVRQVKRAQFLLAADAPEWATVRRVRQGLQRFTATMTGLDDAGVVGLDTLTALGREAPPVTVRSLTVVALPSAALDALESLERPPRWLGLHAPIWVATRDFRDALQRLGALPLERLRLSAESGEVAPGLLAETGLDWVPEGLQRLELRHGARWVVLERALRGWNLELIDLSAQGPRPEDWRLLLSYFGWLKPKSVSLRVKASPDDERVARLEHLARRFALPVAAVAVDERPTELIW